MPENASARLTRISAALREAGDRGNLNALRRGLRAGAAPLIPALHEAARDQLPHTGGLNEYVAGQRITAATRLAGRSASVLIKSSTAASNRQTDSGHVRHPVFPRGSGVLRSSWKWVDERIPRAAHWWTGTLMRESPKVRAALDVAIDEQSRKLNAL